jgi:hypothetical protein
MRDWRDSLIWATLLILFILITTSIAIAYPNQGDWVVTNVESCENENITLNGSLIVSTGAKLTLSKVNLVINNTYPGQFNIKVDPGGSLEIDGSNIKPSNIAYPFRIIVEEGSIAITADTISGVGYLGQNGEDYPTLEIKSVTNAQIKGNYITNVDSLILRLTDVTDSQISDNVVKTLKEKNDPYPQGFALIRSKNNIISNNTITGVYTGMMFFNQSTNNYVAFNTLSPGTADHLGNGIFVNTDSNNNNFHGNTISGPTG